MLGQQVPSQSPKWKKHFITNHPINEWLLHPVASSAAAWRGWCVSVTSKPWLPTAPDPPCERFPGRGRCTGQFSSHRWLLPSPSCLFLFSDQMTHVTKQQYTGFLNGCSCHLTFLTQFHDPLAAALGTPTTPMHTSWDIWCPLALKRGLCVVEVGTGALLRTWDLYFWGQTLCF